MLHVVHDVFAAARDAGDAVTATLINEALPNLTGARVRRLHKRSCGVLPMYVSRRYRKGFGGIGERPLPPQWHFANPIGMMSSFRSKHRMVYPTYCTAIELKDNFNLCGWQWEKTCTVKVPNHSAVVLYSRTNPSRHVRVARTPCQDNCHWPNHGDPAQYDLPLRAQIAAAMELDAVEVCNMQGVLAHPDVEDHFGHRAKVLYFVPRWFRPRRSTLAMTWKSLSDRIYKSQSLCDCVGGSRTRFARALPCIKSLLAETSFIECDTVQARRLWRQSSIVAN